MTWELIGTLYEDLHDSMIERARGIVGADAEDVVHEAYLKVAKELGRTEIENPAGYLTTTVTTTAIDHARRQEKEDLVDPEVITGLIENPFGLTAERAMFVSDFCVALKELPLEEAQAFALQELRGCNQEEIASLTGVNQGTVSRRVERARRALAASLQ